MVTRRGMVARRAVVREDSSRGRGNGNSGSYSAFVKDFLGNGTPPSPYSSITIAIHA